MADYGYRGGANVRDVDIQHVIPTLMIGLGGTGKQILTRVRKRLYDRYGRPSFPFLRTIAFDTDTQPADSVPHGESAPDYANVVMSTGKGELHNVEIGSNGYQLARANFVQRNDMRYRQWMHPDFFELVDETSVTQGSGAYRQAGRLAFISHYGNIHQVVDRELQQIRAYVQDRNRQNDDIPFDVNQNHLDVTIVTSIAGGTGAGMFLDLAYLVKDMLSIDPQVDENRAGRMFDPAGVTSHVTLIAVMPTAFTQQDSAKQDRFRLNAYSALLELEFYNTVRPDDNVFLDETQSRRDSDDAIQFVCNWNGNGDVRIPGRPWNSCYLIDDVNDRNRGAERQTSDVQQMVADYLFLDIGDNAFATKKRSLRSNHADLSTNITYAPVHDPRTGELVSDSAGQQRELLYENRYGCSCSSFGLAEIYIDPDRIRRSASYRLAANLIRDRWLGDAETKSTNASKRQSQHDLFSPDGATDPEKLGYEPEDLIRALLRDEDQDWLESVKRIFDRLTTKNPGNTAPRELLNTLYSALTAIRDSVDGVLQSDARMIKQTLDDRVRALRGHGGKPGPLRKRLNLRSRARIDEIGIRPTLRLLEDYEEDLAKAQKKAGEIGRLPVPTPEQIIARLDDALQVPAPCRKTAVRIEYQRACKEGRDAAILWCRTAAARMLDGIYADALSFVSRTDEGSLGKQYTKWRDFLDSRSSKATPVCSELDTLFDQFRKQPETDRRIPLVPDWDANRYDHEINVELRDRNPDVGPNPSQLDHFDWKRAEQLILSELSDEWKQTKRCDMIEAWYKRKDKVAASIPEIADSARRACGQPLGSEFGLAECSNGNVAAELISRHDCDTLLRRMVDASAPYLPSIPKQRRDRIDIVWKNMLGVTSSGEDDNAQIIAQKVQDLSLDGSNDRRRDAFDPQNGSHSFEESKLVFHRELRGIPVHFYGRLDQLHEHYHHSKMKEDRKTCHISYRQSFGDLPDIKLIDDKEYKAISENAIDVYRGLILGFVNAGDDGIFQVIVPDRFMDIPHPLGSRISRIVKHACCRKQVREFLQNRWSKWKQERASAKHLAVFYNAIQQNMMQVADVVQAGGAAGEMTPPPKNCLEKLLADVKQSLLDEADGEKYFDILKERDPLDRDFDAWKTAFREMCEQIKDKCLHVANEELPILQMDSEKVGDVTFPFEAAASEGSDSASDGGANSSDSSDS